MPLPTTLRFRTGDGPVPPPPVGSFRLYYDENGVLVSHASDGTITPLSQSSISADGGSLGGVGDLIQVRRGTDAQRQTITPADGELIWTTDTKQLHVGDDETVGGNPAGGANLETPKVVHVTSVGVNGSAVVGSPSKPFSTAQAAFNAALAGAGNHVLSFGVGSFGNIVLTAAWPERITVLGLGEEVSLIGTVSHVGANGINGGEPESGISPSAGGNSANITIRGSGVRFTSITSTGGVGGTFSGEGEPVVGGNGGNIIVEGRLRVDSILSQGGDTGSPTAGGNGGSVSIRDLYCDSAISGGGAGSTAGGAGNISVFGNRSFISAQSLGATTGSITLYQSLFSGVGTTEGVGAVIDIRHCTAGGAGNGLVNASLGTVRNSSYSNSFTGTITDGGGNSLLNP